MQPVIRFFVDGTPRSKGSMKYRRYEGAIKLRQDNDRSKPWEYMVQLAALEARPNGAPFGEAWTGPIAVFLRFWFLQPSSYSKTRYHWNSVKPDIDKLTRCALDGLEGVFYRNDSQVTELWTCKGYSIRPGVDILITPVTWPIGQPDRFCEIIRTHGETQSKAKGAGR